MLTISHIYKTFDTTPVLHDVSLSVRRGEILCLLGPSGCGKTTLLRIIAGLEKPDQGQIFWGEELITSVPSYRRDFGLMFQDYVLFPHMTVAQNILFGLKMHDWEQQQMKFRLENLLTLVDLVGYEERPVYELSGGQQQRVALARSLAPNPRLLMLDEPLGALDRTLRDQLLVSLREILQRLGQTALYVTHDQIEAFAVADRIALMREGRIEQLATPEVLYSRPVSSFAARFLGMQNILAGTIRALTPPLIETRLGRLQAASLPSGLAVGDAVQLVIRPEGAQWAAPDAPSPNQLSLSLLQRSFRGTHTVMQFAGPDAERALRFEFAGVGGSVRPGQRVLLSITPEAVVVFAR